MTPTVTSVATIVQLTARMQRDHLFNKLVNGLYINGRWWKNQYNLNSDGVPDPAGVNRHDAMTDLRYLRGLLYLKKLGLAGTEFDTTISQYSQIVKNEFHGSDDHGWAFDEFMILASLTSDPVYTDLAHSQVNFYLSLYDPKLLTIVERKDPLHPHGYCRVDWAIEAACAFIRSGFGAGGNADLTTKGHNILAYLKAHAYIPQYHTFIAMLDNMDSGSPTFYFDTKTKKDGALVKSGEVPQYILSLLRAYEETQDQVCHDLALDLLNHFTPDINTVGLWDHSNQGYYSQVAFKQNGSVKDFGTPTPQVGKKTPARSLQFLETYTRANTLLGGYDVTPLLNLAVSTFQNLGQGWTYEMGPDFSLLKLPDGTNEDWVTTEANGIALEGLTAWLESQVATPIPVPQPTPPPVVPPSPPTSVSVATLTDLDTIVLSIISDFQALDAVLKKAIGGA